MPEFIRNIVPAAIAAVAILFTGCATAPVETETAPSEVAFEPVPEPPIVIPDAPARVPEVPPPAVQMYTVQKGDSVSLIAARYGIRVRDIVDLNGISNPNRIRAGEKLALPADARERELPARVAHAQPSPPAGSYVIQPGDTLSAIAARSGTTVTALREANGLKGNMIRAGRTLVIPGAATATPATPPAEDQVTAPAELAAPTVLFEPNQTALAP